jgi:AcrR family transcriptional regulator
MATQAESRLPLSRERILRAALELADERGVEAVTMRKLAQGLGFEAMSLYNHVANKDDLLDGMLELVLAEIEHPAAGATWDAAIRQSAISVHTALRRHPWSVALLLSPERITPVRFQYMELLLGRLRDAGFDADTTYHAYHALDGHIFGFSLWEASHTLSAEEVTDIIERFRALITPETFPHLYEHGQQHFSEGPHRHVSAFEFALDLILDGLKRLHSQAGA